MTDTAGPELTDDLLVPAVGAVIFAASDPVQAQEIAAAFGGIDVQRVEAAIERLRAQYESSGSGLRVEQVAGGFRLATGPEFGAWVRQFFRQRNRTRLSLAALETLAIVAYRQPVTAPEIQAIRGKDPSAALKGLLDKKLVRMLGKKKVVGSPLLYGTAKEFLVHFGLNSLDDLPSMEDFDAFVGLLETRLPEQAPEPQTEPVATQAGVEADAGSHYESAPETGATE